MYLHTESERLDSKSFPVNQNVEIMSIPRNKLCSPCNLILMICFAVISFGSDSLLVVEILTHVMAQNGMWKFSTLPSVSAHQDSFTHSLSFSSRKTLDCL